MKFGAVPTKNAAGAILAHSMAVPSGRISKGTLLMADHLEVLTKAGHDSVTVARLEAHDVEENAAATTLAQALVPDPQGQHLRVAAAGAGRVNLYAVGPGIVDLDEGRIHQINASDPMITIATLPPFARVDPGTMVATIKIIAYAVPQSALQSATDQADGAIRVQPPVFDRAMLIETQVGSESPPDKGYRSMAERLDRLGLELADRVVVPHAIEPLSDAVDQYRGDVLFLLTASATSDTYDVAPEAVRQAGGVVTAYGMPVDPGNLLFFGKLDHKPVIGLPGCARSPALNGADWVLERLLCGQALDQSDIALMGVGGLLKEIPTRPRPRRARMAESQDT
ncbi:MAG: molybdopterin-binding protein [Pseudomonadota bacterium]